MDRALDEFPTRAEMMALITQLQEQVVELHRAHAVPQNPGQPLLVRPAPPAPVMDFPIEKPPYFDGKRSELTDFITQLRVYFLAQPNRFPSDQARCLAASQFLRGTAYSWIQPYLLQNPLPARLSDLDTFIADLRATFGDPNEEATNARALTNLRQTSTLAGYVTEFTRLSALLAWDPAVLQHLYYNGLRDEIKDELARVDRPADLPSLITQSLRIDHRLSERRVDRNRQGPLRPFNPRLPLLQPRAAGPPVGPLQPPPPPVGPIPMELGANRPPFRRLTPEERERRMQANLCLYCGGVGHQAAQCPVRPPRPHQLAGMEHPPRNPPVAEPQPPPGPGNAGPQMA